MLLSLHQGIARLELVSPAPDFSSYLTRSLDFWEQWEEGEPDLRVRYVEKLSLPEPALLLGEGRGCAGDKFFISDHNGSRALLPFDREGTPEIIAETGFRPATLYVLAIEPFLQLTLLARGYSYVHASAFELDGLRVLLAAAAHVGKTSILLRALSAGARYLADDWAILSAKGELLGYPRPLRLFEYNTSDLPQIRRKLPLGRRSLHLATSGLRRGYERLRASNSFTHRLLGKLVELAVQTSQVHVDADQLFSTSAAPLRGPLLVACFMTGWEGDRVEVIPAKEEEVSRRIAASYAHEQAAFFDHHDQYAAVTGRPGDLKAQVMARMREVTTAALADAHSYSVKIPVSLPRDEVFSQLREKLSQSGPELPGAQG